MLLPLPRPEWAGGGDDRTAFGAAVQWREEVGSEAQDIIEATMAAAGLLGAGLTPAGAQTNEWAVDITGPTVEPNLGGVLTTDPSHPMTDVAAAVLTRVTLARTAIGGDAPGLVIGADGTFRAGARPRGDTRRSPCSAVPR